MMQLKPQYMHIENSFSALLQAAQPPENTITTYGALKELYLSRNYSHKDNLQNQEKQKMNEKVVWP